jgi:3-oxoacyl-[acyl-carrier-protein] synthase III
MRWGNMYVASTGVHLPERVSVAGEVAAGRYDPEEAERTGMISYTHAADGGSSLEYAAKAARLALDATPNHIRLGLRALYHTFVGPPGGPPAWNPASMVHQLLDLGGDVIPYGVTNGCAMGLACIEEACLRLNGDPTRDLGAALVVASEVWPPELVNPLTSTRGLILADGAGAIVVSNIGGFAAILATASQIDSRLADATRGAESLAFDPNAKVDLGARFDHFASREVDARTYRTMRDDLAVAVADEVLKDAGLRLDQIDAFVFTHSGARNLRNGYFRLFPGSEQRTNTESIGLHTGHIGTADWFMGLHELRASGALKGNDRVMMMGGAGGWVESAVVLRMR